MIKYLLLFILPFSLYASKILSYNVYERSDRDDIMITFDTPYSGTIKQSLSPSKIIIKLGDASIESPKTKKFNSKYIHSLYINPVKNHTNITVIVAKGTKLVASKTSDAYGLRLRFISINAKRHMEHKTLKTPSSISSLPTKKEITISTSYYVVVTLLILAIILLFVFKKKILLKKEKNTKDSWLFKSSTNIELPTHKETTDVSIRFQKSIDSTNSVVMLDFGKQSYLVLMGSSNILLERFEQNQPKSQEDFESILQSRHAELDRFLEKESPATTEKEPLQIYKEKAASLLYTE